MAIKRNIFVRDYEKRENELTESLLIFLSNSNTAIVNNFLRRIKQFFAHTENISTVDFVMQQKGTDSTPDASIYEAGKFFIHIEVKRFKERIRISQLDGHYKDLLNKDYRKKCLLIITNDYSEPKELKRFRHLHVARDIDISFLSWADIYSFVESIPKIISDKKDIFLQSQYLDYLKKEGLKYMKWPGFKKQDAASWLKYLHMSNGLNTLLEDIKDQLKKKSEWDEIKPKKTNERSYMAVSFVRKRRRKAACTLYLGVWFDEEEEKIKLYGEWWWTGGLENVLTQKKGFMGTKKKLIRKGYKAMRNDSGFQKVMAIDDMMIRKDLDAQRKKISKFVDSVVNDYERCAIKNLLRTL
jgi:hypothetical protein